MYTLDSFDSMLANEPRARPFLAAVTEAVRAGGVLVEIGTGVGYFAVAAARAGARHVYAIEMNDAVTLGPEVAAANSCADRITFIRGHSMRVTLPERGDVLLEDIRGILPMSYEHIPSVVDARRRHLRPGATIIAARDELWAAPCEADDHFVTNHSALGDVPHGIDRRVIDARVRRQFYRARIEPAQLLAEPVNWASLDYATVESPHVSGRAAWTVARAGQVEGFCVWFDSHLGFGQRITNAPGAPRTVYGHAFFPLARAIVVVPGDRLDLELRATYAEGAYVWSWNTDFQPIAGNGRRPQHITQSNLEHVLPASDQLNRRRGDHVPRIVGDAPVVAEILRSADGTRTLDQIADRLMTSHVGRFTDRRAALRFASHVLGAIEDESPPESPR